MKTFLKWSLNRGEPQGVLFRLVLSFFSELCIERNLKSSKTSSTRKIENVLTALRNL